MADQDRFNRLDSAIADMQRTKQQQTGSDEPTDPKVVELLARGMKIIEELDPIVRETYRDNPEALAEWEDIMRMRDGLPEDEKS